MSNIVGNDGLTEKTRHDRSFIYGRLLGMYAAEEDKILWKMQKKNPAERSTKKLTLAESKMNNFSHHPVECLAYIQSRFGQVYSKNISAKQKEHIDFHMNEILSDLKTEDMSNFSRLGPLMIVGYNYERLRGMKTTNCNSENEQDTRNLNKNESYSYPPMM